MYNDGSTTVTVVYNRTDLYSPQFQHTPTMNKLQAAQSMNIVIGLWRGKQIAERDMSSCSSCWPSSLSVARAHVVVDLTSGQAGVVKWHF